MKIKVKRAFSYMDGVETRYLHPGVHDLPKDIAEKVLRWGKAEIVKTPPKKKGRAPENKARVAK